MGNTITINSNAALAFLGSIFVFALIGAVVYVILQFIGKALAFRKMGEPAIKVFIPFYGDWILYKKTWTPLPGFWIMFALYCLIGTFSNGLQNQNNSWFVFLVIALSLVAFIIRILFLYRIAKAFGMHGAGTVMGVFIEPVFWLVVGCCRSYQYIGSGDFREKLNMDNNNQVMDEKINKVGQ